MTTTFDKIAYIDRLRAAGFPEPQARALADGLDQALQDEVATKSDIAAVRNEIDVLRIDIKTDVARLRGELKGELSGLKDELLAAMKSNKVDFLTWIVMLIVGQTVAFAAFKVLAR